MDVGVDWDDEICRRDRPQPQIHAVGRPNHPPRIEDESLTGAAGAGIAHQMPRASIGGVAAQTIGQTRQAFTKIATRLVMVERERVAERTVLLQERSGLRQQLREVVRAVDAVNETSKPPLELKRATRRNERGGLRPQHLQGALDALSRGNRVPERETCSDQPNDLAIGLEGIAMHVVDRIARTHRDRVAVGQESFETVMDRGHVSRVLAILPSQPQ